MPEKFAKTFRPVVINTWEAFLFDINEKCEENKNFISYNESNKENIKKINNALNLLEDVVNDLKKQI